jgi:nucleoside-diphosphate-sugar epimerase
MTTFVTGGTSSIGRVLIKELARQGEAVRVLVRPSSDRSGLELPGVEFWNGDVTDLPSLQAGMQNCQRVTHLAAVVGGHVPEATWWRVNRDGTRNVMQTALDLSIQSVVHVSSIASLGFTQPGQVGDEKHVPDPLRDTTLYHKTKRAGDEVVREFAARGLQASIVWPGFGFGCSRASSHPSMQEATLLRMAAGKPLVIMGSGKNRICMSYYRDTVAGILLAHCQGKPGEGYVLTGENLTFPEIWAAVAAVLGKEPPKRRIPLKVLKTVSGLGGVFGKELFPSDFFDMIGRDCVYRHDKAVRELGWQPHTFLDAIRETWAEYQTLGWKA